jgi:hypothetical protein
MIRFLTTVLFSLSSNNSKPIEFSLITFAFDCRLNQLRFPLPQLNRKNREPHFSNSDVKAISQRPQTIFFDIEFHLYNHFMN